MIVSQKTVRRKFRSIIEAEYPTLNLNQAYWKWMEYLIFGTYKDEDNRNELVASAEILARIERKMELLETDNYNAGEFLQAFKTDVMPYLEWNTWNYDDGKARTIKPVNWPIHIREAITMEMQDRWKDDTRVYFVDGSVYSLGKERIEREETRMQALNTLKHAGNQKAKYILEYLNSLTPHRFSKIKKNIDSAYLAAINLESANDETIFHQIAVLRAINDQAQPFYQPSKRGKTVRIFGLNESILSLRKEIRRALCPDWIELDIVSSQLAINAMLWDIPEVTQFLKTTEISIWQSLFNHFQIPFDKTKKGIFKDALYALCFGMARKKLYKILNAQFTNGGRLFFSHPIIKVLYTARQRMIRQIEMNGGARLIDGTWISTANNTSISILAQMAQAVELEAIYEIYQLAANTDDFTCVLHQHDGVSISFKSRQDYWLHRIIQVVNTRLLSMNIHTCISYS